MLFSENVPERLPVCWKMNSLPAIGPEPNNADAIRFIRLGFIMSFDGGIVENVATLCVNDVGQYHTLRCPEAKKSG